MNRWRGTLRFAMKGLYYGWYIVVACNFVALMPWAMPPRKRRDLSSDDSDVRIASAGLSAL